MAGMVMSDFGIAGVIPIIMSIVPMAFVVIGIVMGVRFMKKYQAFNSSPVRGQAAIITSKRTAISSSDADSMTRTATSYFITAEYEDGSRQELTVMEHSLFGRLAEGDAGVLFTRFEFALDFDRVQSL